MLYTQYHQLGFAAKHQCQLVIQSVKIHMPWETDTRHSSMCHHYVINIQILQVPKDESFFVNNTHKI